MSQPWLRAERRVERAFQAGRRRRGPGRKGPDLQTACHVIEVKIRKLPKWLTGALAQAQKYAPLKVPVAVFYPSVGPGQVSEGVAVCWARDVKRMIRP